MAAQRACSTGSPRRRVIADPQRAGGRPVAGTLSVPSPSQPAAIQRSQWLRGYRGLRGTPALKGTCQVGETHTDKTLERYGNDTAFVRGGLERWGGGGGQGVERGLSRSGGLPRKGAGHSRDRGPGARSRAVQWEQRLYDVTLWEGWLRTHVRTKKPLGGSIR